MSDITDAGMFSELKGNQLAQVPRHQGVARVEFVHERGRATFQGRYVGTQYENDANTLKLSPLFTFDASLSASLVTSVEVVASVENLFGTTYQVGETADGVTTIGAPTVVMAGLRVRF